MIEGYINLSIENEIGRIKFFHPKGNSLPSYILERMKSLFKEVSHDEKVKVVILESEGKTFCAGASFDELLSINTLEEGEKFFFRFGEIMIAMKNCPKFIIAKVQGKSVGGGLGLISASDYVIALENASVRLSELTVGIGPFVIGHAVERKVGKNSFQAMSIDCEWRDSQWAKANGLYSKIANSEAELELSVIELAQKLTKVNPEAVKKIKSIFWEGTEHWDELLKQRALMSGELILSDFSKNYIQNFITSTKNNSN